ncbi:MAG TPA: GNAT family N-acetyltransferase [Bryobacteraceae bacterium]|nr:GNAT family N-acetyltransferase [Bryobacteraceae bacterium]
MTGAPFRVEPLCDAHDRASFDCGEEALNRYFQTQATQDIRRRVANCFVAVGAASGQIAAYYTLSAASIPMTDLPPDESKRLPRYPAIPAVRIGRLAVDRRFQGRGLGAAMLADATARVIQSDIAAVVLIVDAKNDAAIAFYQRHEFRLITGSPRTLFLPIATARKFFPGKS